MKSQIEQKIKIITLGLLALLLLAGPVTYAADDPSIKGDLRTNIQATMDTFIKSQTIDGTLRLYDPVEDVLLKVKLKKLHPGIVKKGDFFVSCADFVDLKGRKYDLDFLVVPAGDKLITTQAIVHSVDGKKRKYHLE
ncbi:MAG TPA: hypothetical protein ENI67_00985 [Gammaproteobacteria bacterium]|nr:hypothetical protein [Gammaproteobacteria bacterium]